MRGGSLEQPGGSAGSARPSSRRPSGFQSLQRTLSPAANIQDESDGHIHADNGAASLNLWITPDESNLETDTGGLVLWNKAVPDEYFDAAGEEMMHKTHRLKFRDAHPHRRVSITFLYGKPGH